MLVFKLLIVASFYQVDEYCFLRDVALRHLHEIQSKMYILFLIASKFNVEDASSLITLGYIEVSSLPSVCIEVLSNTCLYCLGERDVDLFIIFSW